MACLLVLQSITVSAATPVSLRESFAGNISFALTGGSFRTSSNNQNACARNTTSSNPLTSLPLSSKIKKAYLYWAASSENSSFTDNTVTLNNQSIIANRTFTDSSGSNYFYSGVADVTGQIKTSRNTIYSVSGLDIFASTSRCNNQTVLGGWSLLVIYEDDNADFSVLNVYEGFQYFQRDAAVSSLTLSPSNFKLPSINPKGKHAHITWEGDDTIGYDGEGLTFEGSDLFDSSGGNNLGNQFDSYSNIEGGLTTYGVDIDAYDISSFLTAGASSVSTTYTARQDGVLLSAEVIKVSNIPVADLAVTTSNPSGWKRNTNVTKKFTISNNGPNDIPAQSARFTTILPAGLSFNGTQADSKWTCTQTGQSLSCIYKAKLRSGWSDYLDLNLSIANNTNGQNLTITANVDHDTAPYDIFDNHQPNNSYSFTVPISNNDTVDLSASSKTYSNLNGDLLLAGDTLQYSITIDDSSPLPSSNISVTDHLPANISAYRITENAGATVNFSAGGDHGSGILTFTNISLSSDQSKTITIEVDISNTAPVGASLQNIATVSYGSDSWLLDSGDITVVEPDLSASTKIAEDVNSGWLLPEETVRYTLNLKEASNLEIINAQVTDNLPAHISAFEVISLPAGATDFSVSSGGANGSGIIDIRNINIASGQTATIIIDATVDTNTPDQTSMKNTATISLGSKNWSIQSDDLVVSLLNNAPASGNKPLYLVNANLTRNLPSTNTVRSFNHGETLTWPLQNPLQKELKLAAGDMRLNLAVEGHRTGSIQTQLNATLFYNDNVGGGNITISNGTIPNANYRINTLYDAFVDLPLAAELTIPKGSTIYLSIYNQSSNSINNQYALIDIHSIHNGFLSSVTLNANTVINIESLNIYSAAFTDSNNDFVDDSGASVISTSQPDTQISIRASISDPFGAFDISQASIEVLKANGTAYDFSAHPAPDNNNLMNAIDNPNDDSASSDKLFEKTITLLETNEITGFWTIIITAYEGLEPAASQVTHTATYNFKITPFLPNITLEKTIQVINDPINGLLSAGNKPKAIPGAELQYTIHAINTGRGKSDDNTIILQDEIPEKSALYIGNLTCPLRGPGTGAGPICFSDGTGINVSGLSYSFISTDELTDDIRFSIDGTDFDYQPQDDGDGYDPAIRHIRLTPKGTLLNRAKNGTESPEFKFTYQIRLD